eukprot:3940488-Rhodomonas_salina.2
MRCTTPGISTGWVSTQRTRRKIVGGQGNAPLYPEIKRKQRPYPNILYQEWSGWCLIVGAANV